MSPKPPKVRTITKLGKPRAKSGRKPRSPEYLRAKGYYKAHPEEDPLRKEGAAQQGGLDVMQDYPGIAKLYAEQMFAAPKGTVSTLARLACERHLRDLAKQRTTGFPYYFDPIAADRACARIESFPHIKGRWALQRQKLKLEPWQVFGVASVFGWKRCDNHMRRFREVYWRVPRKNAKSTIAAAIGNVFAFDDGEFGSEVYSGATTEKQAWEVFGPARLMLERSPEIAEEFGVEVWSKSLIRPADNSRFLPIIGKPGDGASPSCAIVDEFHEHQTSDLVDTMVTGMGAREQPMLFIITTAGTNLASPCYDKDREAQKMLEGVSPNEELFALIYTIDEEDDWTDPAILPKANPNLGVSVDRDFLLAQQRNAMTNPAYQNRFRTKHLNQWCGSSVAGINMHSWRNCANPSMKIEEFEGEECVLALDLASKIDICAKAYVFTRIISGARHYYAFLRYYLPEETIAEADINKQSYQKWVIEGRLTATPGAEVDFDQVSADVQGGDLCAGIPDNQRFQIREIVYDPWRATQLAHQLTKAGASCVEMGQSARNMGEAFDELLTAIKAQRFHHDGDPVLEWMASNTIAKQVTKGLMVPSKEKPDEKIDGIVAVVMCIARAMVVDGESAGIGEWLKGGPVVVS